LKNSLAKPLIVCVVMNLLFYRFFPNNQVNTKNSVIGKTSEPVKE
jgi:hypothetical protein